MKTFGALMLASLIAGTSTAVNLAVPNPEAQPIQALPCEDGAIMVKFFDPDPANPAAGVFEFWLDGVRLGAQDMEAGLVYVDSLKKAIPIAEAAESYGDPCGLPRPGTGT